MFSQSLEQNNDSDLNVSSQWKNFNIYDEEQKNCNQNENSVSFIDDRALRMMQKMGYKSGSGLGKDEQGITEAIDVTGHLGKRGLGLDIPNINATKEQWDFAQEVVNVKENVVWLKNEEKDHFNFCSVTMTGWMKEGIPHYNIEHEFNFCERNILHDVLKAKDIFDELNLLELYHARTRANPFETIRTVFFMNRAALKMANIDAATEFMFSSIDQNIYHKGNSGPFYFADVCAGPGGFSEYILWRKKWLFQGFGLTLKDDNDFKLYDSLCASSVPFQAFYGALDDGNVCCPENIEDFKTKVLHQTEGKGVHFMMSDGGFSVEGNENYQEILSKNIYICQCLVALEVVRAHGHFVTKLFDIFTPFSVGLLFLVYNCFEKVTILKPNSSRPANSERYFVCYNLKEGPVVENIKIYLRSIVRRLWEVKDNSELDIVEIVPLDIIKGDEKFYSYIVESNNSLGKRQIVGLQKLAAFCRNPNLIEIRQEELRKKCLDFWQIPNITRIPQPHFTPAELLSLVMDKPEIILVQPREVNNMEDLKLKFSDAEDWHYCPMYGPKASNNCCFYAGIGPSRVYRLQTKRWGKVKNLQLVTGTILYGEFVKEKNVLKNNFAKNAPAESYKYSLHVIDALRLGDKSLTEMRFKERMELIKIYCKSVNKESISNSVRIRPKPMDPLTNIATQPLLKLEKQRESYISSLPTIGFNTFSETFDVHSLLLLKTNDNQSFYSTYVLRVQIFINTMKNQDEESLTFENLVSHFTQK